VLDATGGGADIVKGGRGRDICYVDAKDTVRSCEVTKVAT